MFDFDISDVGIILPSHPRQQIFMEQAMLSYKNWSGGPIIFIYDDIDTKMLPTDLWSPPVSKFICTNYEPGTLGHVKGELYTMMLGGRELEKSNVRYIYKTAADTTCYRHYKFVPLIKELKATKVNFIRAGTAAIFGRVEDFNKVLENVEEDIKEYAGIAESYWGVNERKNNFTHLLRHRF